MDLISDARNLLYYKRKARIDNVAFTLHKITAGVLLFFSALVSSGVYVKKPIICSSDKAVEHVIDAYCWIHSTFTVLNKTNENLGQALAAHPGVAPHDDQDELRDHKYYQWVCFVLFFQAIAFYLPRKIWKELEGGKVHSLSSVGLEDIDKDEQSLVTKRKKCVDYFHRSLGTHDSWAMKYAICEVLNFVNVVVQIYLTDLFVGKALSRFGLSLLQFKDQNPMLRTDPMSMAFPTVTRCTFMMIGPTGNIINFDNLCVLPLNIYNEKFYPLLWVWFILLAVISGLALLYRVAVFLLPEIRHELLKRKFMVANREINKLYRLNLKLDYGDWFLLYSVGKNMRPSVFCDFLDDLIERLGSDGNYTKAFQKEKNQ